jgi:hypothetical protein
MSMVWVSRRVIVAPALSGAGSFAQRGTSGEQAVKRTSEGAGAVVAHGPESANERAGSGGHELLRPAGHLGVLRDGPGATASVDEYQWPTPGQGAERDGTAEHGWNERPASAYKTRDNEQNSVYFTNIEYRDDIRVIHPRRCPRLLDKTLPERVVRGQFRTD